MVQAAQDLFTPTEAAALTGVGVKVVRKEIERRVIRPKRLRRRAHRQVGLELADLLYLRVLAGLDLELPARARARIRSVIQGQWSPGEPQKELVVSGSLTLKVEEAAAQVIDLLRRFAAWRDSLPRTPEILGGPPVFPGSRLAVSHIGGMLEHGEPPAAIQEDYPFLTDEDLELARVYARAYPHVGRPKAREAPAR